MSFKVVGSWKVIFKKFRYYGSSQISLFEVPFLLVRPYFYPKITSLILDVPSSFFNYLTDIHNYEFIGKTPSNLSIIKFTLFSVLFCEF